MDSKKSTSKWTPVPKVLAQTITGLIAALVVAWLVQEGMERGQAGEIGSLAGALVVALAPVIVGFVGGYLKKDPERAMLLQVIEDAIDQDDKIQEHEAQVESGS